MHQGMLYQPLDNGQVRCQLCQRQCRNAPGRTGYCQTRLNENGGLYTLVYDQVSPVAVDPIEQKPLFHFYPTSQVLSLGTFGCNFRCIHCQNYTISHVEPGTERYLPGGRRLGPQEAVELARQTECSGIAWTYNEPTVWFEYTLEGAKLAKASGLLTHYVTNGFITPEALDMIGPYLDAFRVDIKGFSKKLYRKMCHIDDFKGILDTTKRARHRWGMWVEIITNVTPGYNDDEAQLKDIAAWIRSDLGEFTPWHVTQFVPHLELSHIPATPVPALEKAREIGLGAGLKYVYLGNVWGHPAENTYCHNCRKALIERSGFSVSRYEIKEDKCPYCQAIIPGRFDQTGGNEKQSWTNPAAGLN
jgi:pyruvate formate lyase activating enzyme